MRIMRFPIFLAFPLRCIDEVLEGWTDIMCLFKRTNATAFATLSAVDDALAIVRAHEPFDLADIDAGGRDGRVRIRLLLR